MTQTNIQHGQIVLSANEDLTGKEGLLVKIVDSSGTPEVALPSAITDLALYVLIDGDSEDGLVSILPLSSDRNIRVRLKGVCVPGDVLVLATTSGGDAGKVRKLPTTAGTYRALLIAEESGVDGQLVKARPAMLGNITV